MRLSSHIPLDNVNSTRLSPSSALEPKKAILQLHHVIQQQKQQIQQY